MRMTKTKSLILTGLFAALTAAGAFIRVPMWPVGIPLQVLVTALSGMLLGGRMGAASQAIYLLIGLAGVPVFSEGGGIGYIARPSFGFLVGLMPMAFVIGTLARKRMVCPACLPPVWRAWRRFMQSGSRTCISP
jgi:biotin transport system substrate-specific component